MRAAWAGAKASATTMAEVACWGNKPAMRAPFSSGCSNARVTCSGVASTTASKRSSPAAVSTASSRHQVSIRSTGCLNRNEAEGNFETMRSISVSSPLVRVVKMA